MMIELSLQRTHVTNVIEALSAGLGITLARTSETHWEGESSGGTSYLVEAHENTVVVSWKPDPTHHLHTDERRSTGDLQSLLVLVLGPWNPRISGQCG